MKEFKLSIKDSALAFISSFIFCQLGVILFGILLMSFCTTIGIPKEQYEIFTSSAVGTLLTMLITNSIMLGVYFYFKRKDSAQMFVKPSLKKTISYISIAILSFVMLYPIIHCIDYLLFNLGIISNGLSYELNTTNYLISIISVVILPAICEELLFRGIILKGLKNGGKTFSILVSSLIFSLYHVSIYQTIYPLLMGILFALIMYKENNLFYTIVMHAVNNFISLTLLYFNITLAYNHWTYLLIAIVLVTIFITAVLALSLKNNKNSKTEKIQLDHKFYIITAILIMLSIWIAYNILLINM